MKDLRFKRKYFLMIQSGEKSLECRVNYNNLRDIKKGQRVKFFWEHLSLVVEIVDIRKYPNFKEMLSREVVAKLVPGMSPAQALTEYESIYSEWKVKQQGGLIVFEFKIVS